ncbi:MAG: hypothetical protein Q8M94_11030, partial [Ignavibacteria bacterium]|nr:hypothetical protein [Ignavibacteria bacterium]
MKNYLLLISLFLLSIIEPAKSQNFHWELLDSSYILMNHSNVGSQLRYWAVDCADSLNCIAIGNLQMQLPFAKGTTDGGKTWTTVLTDTNINGTDYYFPKRLCDVSYIDTNLCIIVADSGYYWRSTDRCRTWTKSKYNANYSKKLAFEYRISMFDNLRGGIATPLKDFLLTTDGGMTWYIPTINLSDSLLPTGSQDIQIVDEKTVVALAYNQTFKDYIIRSDDFGLNWNAYTT